MVPLIRSLISIPAGMSNMKFGMFLLFTTIGTLIWNVILVTVGAMLGESWEDIVAFMDVYSHLTYAVIAVALVVLLFLFFRKRKKSA